MDSTLTRAASEPDQSERWAAIEREILGALSETELSLDSRRRVQIHIGPTGIVLTGELLMGWERDLVKVIAQLHNHGLPVFSHVH